MARADLHIPESAAASGGQPLFVRRDLPPDLTGIVARLTGYQENGQALRQAPEVASMVVPLVISFSDPFEIALSRRPTPEDRYASFTSGLYPGYVVISSTGAAQCVQIDFTPLGAYCFFGLPMTEIAGRMVTLEELGDPGLMELRDRLAALNDWGRRLGLVEEFVRQRVNKAESDVSAVAWAYDMIMKRGGDTRIQDLAAALDWSRKHLNVRFHETVGVGPKTVARMARFNHAIEIANAGNKSWADIAFAAGYADQAHMSREFREFAGTTPRQFAETRGR